MTRLRIIFIATSILGWHLCSGQQTIPQILRAPYLQTALADSVSILWKTASGTSCKAMVRAENTTWRTATGTVAKAKYGYMNTVTIHGLQHGVRYQYRIFTDDQELLKKDSLDFISPVDTKRPFSFFTAGDIGEPVGEGGKPDKMAVGITKLKERPNFGLLLGDIVYPNGESEGYDKHLFPYFRDVFARIPTFAVLGNHDWVVNPEENFLKEWKLPGNGHYYSFDYSNAHFIALDSKNGDFHEFDKQKAWLESDLRNAQGKYDWIIVFLHHNGISCTYKEDYTKVMELYPLFAQYKVDVVLNGHAHTYERLNPMDGKGMPIQKHINTPNVYRQPEGFISITAGSGGKLRGFGTDPTYYAPDPERCSHPKLVAFSKHLWAFMQIHIDGRQLWAEAIDTKDGSVFDYFRVVKNN
jgi:predicted phosphodiesterase